jgi:cell wall-associated NlpC family hydrolase
MNRLVDYALHFVKTPYQWADKSPVLGGYDCSGFVCEVLRAAGLVGNKEVLNAQMLFDRFSVTGTTSVRAAGSLAFYGESITKIDHVAFMIDQYRIIEAGGGDSTTTTLEAADLRNAMVRMRLVGYRSDLVATVKPRYATIGLF